MVQRRLLSHCLSTTKLHLIWPTRLLQWLTDVRLTVIPQTRVKEKQEKKGWLTICFAVNEARAMRVMELMNDFRTLQIHVTSLITRSEANPPDQQSYYLDGYVVLRQCAAESQAVLASHFNPGSIGLQAGHVPETEVQKATLQRCELSYLAIATKALTGCPESCWMLQPEGSRRTKSIYEHLPACGGFKCAHKFYEATSQLQDMSMLFEQLIKDFGRYVMKPTNVDPDRRFSTS